jgi:hypothetical protein
MPAVKIDWDAAAVRLSSVRKRESPVTRSATGWGAAKANEASGGGVQEWLLGEP